jgi:hypothetical protein
MAVFCDVLLVKSPIANEYIQPKRQLIQGPYMESNWTQNRRLGPEIKGAHPRKMRHDRHLI